MVKMAVPVGPQERHGRLTATEDLGTRGKYRWARWRCDCGLVIEAVVSNVRGGKTMSCGCLRSEMVRRRNTKHGQIGTRAHNIWSAIKERCTNERQRNYKNYGGRGIRVCERWSDKQNGFSNFMSDMGSPPTDKHSIDRFPNKDGDYEPGNCRWATRSEQMRNTRRTAFVMYEGREMSTPDLAELSGVNINTARGRIRKGWNPTLAATTPVLRLRSKGRPTTSGSQHPEMPAAVAALCRAMVSK